MIMPLTITKLKMWKDPGYTRECVEVPPRGSWKMPSADYVSSEDLRPRKGSTLTAVELPLPYLQVMDMSYLYIEVEDGVTPTPNTVKLFGWIVSIEETASSNEAVRITWTVDYWRTYSGSAVFGAGTVTRCPDGTYKRPYQTQPRKWVFSKKEDIYPLGDNPEMLPEWYVIVSYNDRTYDSTTQTYTVTRINTAFWGCSLGSGEGAMISGTMHRSPSLPEVFLGNLTDVLGIPPEAINSVFISPVPPDTPSLSSPSHYITHTDGGNQKRFAYLAHAPYQGSNYTHDLATTYVSDDTHKTVLIDPTGAIVYTLPWGMSVSRISIAADAGTSAMTIKVSLLSGSSEDNQGVQLASEARMVSIPLINAPVNSNGYASYNFSGQREYDMNVREIQRQEKMIGGLSNIGMSAIGGGIAGKGLGAIAGGLSSGAALALDYHYSGVFNDKLQEETDKLYANQIPSLIQGAGGIAPFTNRTTSLLHWYIVQLEADSVSAAEYAQHIVNDGHTVEIPVADATSFVTAGGALQIQNLMLTGDIPPAGKSYIKNILSNGVRIVENNPTGVNP